MHSAALIAFYYIAAFFVLEEIRRIYLVVNPLGLGMINPRRLEGFVDQRSDPRKYLLAHKLLRRFYQPSVHTHIHATKAMIAACRYATYANHHAPCYAVLVALGGYVVT